MSPYVKFLKGVSEPLKALGYPIYFKLPGPEVKEPFIVIGSHVDDDSATAKMGPSIISADLQIDIFLPAGDRALAEEVTYRARMLLGRRQRVLSDIRIDKTIGREVYHVIIKIEDYIR